ncbi:DUF421 domain-containing protein [Paenibacillus sp. CMAA1739]|uniref:YetF domain-containing protein n=1 Tax=Paenibacillus ottowii TaxID=2315729 RepID=UPI0011B1A881|nr:MULTISPECIES: DUF421 domain-containing protein [Paenibacillus]MDP1512801.1 DUF421 domain-containing protein [Paenibacillus ottowii]MEC4568720.1 DUF421 domain-containing protein [Paenibacillus sp. CMAA1739]QDY82488.1 DUF421 domain-containing protein [Paenibacillus polymyxa]
MELWETMLRSISAFALMMFLARLLGKPTIAQMTYHDFVAVITLGSITANLAFNNTISIRILLTSMLTFTGIAYLLMVLAMKNQKLRSWFSGKPTVLIQEGKIMEGNMRKLKVTLDTLNQELRGKNFFNIQDVQYAVLELNGSISVLPKPDCMPVIKKDLHLKSQSEQAFPIELIMDGDIIEANLQQNNLTTEWLQSQIKKKGLSLKEINYAVISTDGNVYFDEYKDQIESPIDKE